MKIELWAIGKTSFPYLEEGFSIYQKRLGRYLKFTWTVFSDVKNAKNLSEQELKKKEGQLFLDKIRPQDALILLDENGKQYSSVDFSNFLQRQLLSPQKRLIFIIGGAYGFSDDVYQRANFKISLSKMTFSHQMVRLIFVEQLYRAMTILNNEPYHHK